MSEQVVPIVPLIALGGGPGAGKSEMKEILTERLRHYGVNVWFIEEVATSLILNGIRPDVHGKYFQQMLAKIQIAHEDSQLSEARSALRRWSWKRIVAFVDRGLPDGAGYLAGDDVRAAFEHDILVGDSVLGLKMTMDDVFARYVANIHLVTAADGAPKAYMRFRKNNPARTETVKQAKYRDRRILAAWNDHPNVRVVKNVNERGKTISFEQKTEVVLGHIFDILGIQPGEKVSEIDLSVG
ncbi:MAG: AAA family ATPase [bacterium]|nr:AAA family ATPase [bacterium]